MSIAKPRDGFRGGLHQPYQHSNQLYAIGMIYVSNIQRQDGNQPSRPLHLTTVVPPTLSIDEILLVGVDFSRAQKIGIGDIEMRSANSAT
ncbi:hypothetical protein M422DRAFT_247276 [Sphaerobolus stellatus SS14]|nr:hypothetical protein M422DRAFT_247276 [Sphaerobolus stellatus SS14]